MRYRKRASKPCNPKTAQDSAIELVHSQSWQRKPLTSRRCADISPGMLVQHAKDKQHHIIRCVHQAIMRPANLFAPAHLLALLCTMPGTAPTYPRICDRAQCAPRLKPSVLCTPSLLARCNNARHQAIARSVATPHCQTRCSRCARVCNPFASSLRHCAPASCQQALRYRRCSASSSDTLLLMCAADARICSLPARHGTARRQASERCNAALRYQT